MFSEYLTKFFKNQHFYFKNDIFSLHSHHFYKKQYFLKSLRSCIVFHTQVVKNFFCYFTSNRVANIVYTISASVEKRCLNNLFVATPFKQINKNVFFITLTQIIALITLFSGHQLFSWNKLSNLSIIVKLLGWRNPIIMLIQIYYFCTYNNNVEYFLLQFDIWYYTMAPQYE